MSVPLSKTYEYRSAYDRRYREANRERRRQLDREYQARIKAEHLRGSCAECGAALAGSASGICKACKEWERVAGLQAVVDCYLRVGVLRSVAAETGRSPNKVGTILATLRASGHPIPRRRQGGAGWLDPMPAEPIVIARGDYTRGVEVIAARAAARRGGDR
jgi:hypothetical protein